MRYNLPHLDTSQQLFFSRSLESIDKTPYQTLFAGMLGRRYIPNQEGVPEWANVYTYRMYEQTGKAKIIGPGVNDLPRVGVTAVEASRIIKQIGVSYGWTVREIQQAAATGQALDMMTVNAARNSVARQVDDLLATGSSTYNIQGLLNVSGVNVATASTKTGSGAGTAWIRAVPVAPDEILADINLIVATARGQLKQAGDEVPVFARFTLLISSANYAYIASTPRSPNSDTSILKWAIANNPWIESIEEWYQCDAAGGSTSPRMVCYPRDPLCVAALVPQEFTSLPPQEEGLGFVIPATGSCGGVVCRYPVAMQYMDHL